MNLRQEIEASLDACVDHATREAYINRLQAGRLERDLDPISHFCAYFVPFNPNTKEVLIGDHKKSGLWLMPGGHIDAGETLCTTINREIEEELGVKDFFDERPEPFLMTITNIVTDVRPCKQHFDVWHVVETDGADFEIDYTEYHEVQWATIPKGRDLVTDPANLAALTELEKMYS